MTPCPSANCGGRPDTDGDCTECGRRFPAPPVHVPHDPNGIVLQDPPGLHDFVEAWEAYDGDDVDAFLSEWQERLAPPVHVKGVGVVRGLTDVEALDAINLLLSAEEWPGASGMEDVAAIVALTGRVEIDDAPEWRSH